MTNHSDTMIRSVCVYCGSSPGNDPQFIEAAKTLGRTIAENNIRLVYGGGDIGIMGAVAESVLAANGEVLGIIPEFLLKSERGIKPDNLSGATITVVPDMHIRKKMMFEEADAFIALPGGIGTLEELVEIQTWSQLGRHTKPICVLNINEFWSPYIELVGHMAKSGFLHNPDKVGPRVFDNASEVISGLLAGR